MCFIDEALTLAIAHHQSETATVIPLSKQHHLLGHDLAAGLEPVEVDAACD